MEKLPWFRVGLLALTQGLSMTTVNLTVISSILAATSLTDSLVMASIPFGLQYITAMLLSFTVRKFIARMGQKGRKQWALALGQFMGVLGGLVSMAGLYGHDFLLFALGGILIGAHNSFWGFIAFAAGELVGNEHRARVLSLVTAGGVLAAFLGSFLAQNSRDLLIVPFMGVYAAFALVAFVNVMLFLFLPLSKGGASKKGEQIALGQILQNKFTVMAIALVALSYMTMNFIMTASTVSMHHHNIEFADISNAIKWHVLAMFVPSFFTGFLIDKLGFSRIILLGLFAYAISTAIHLSGVTYQHHVFGLIFLGLGWNFLFVAGSVLLSSKIPSETMIKAQAISAIITQLCQSFTSFSTGFWLNLLGWDGAIWSIILPLFIVVGLFLLNYRQLRRLKNQ